MPPQVVRAGPSYVDVLDRVLDKGIVIDAWVRVSLVGIELVTVDARVVVASIATYFEHSDALAELPKTGLRKLLDNSAQCNTDEGLRKLAALAEEWKNRSCPDCGASYKFWKAEDTGEVRCGRCGTLLVLPPGNEDGRQHRRT
jgi:ribosomal protein S27AE